MSATVAPRTRPLIILFWTLRIVVAAVFLLAAVAKLSGQPMMVAEFGQVGLGQWFRVLTAIIEIVGAVAVLAPQTVAYGAGLLLMVDAGAAVAQVTWIHMGWVHTVVIGAALAGIIVLQRRLAGR